MSAPEKAQVRTPEQGRTRALPLLCAITIMLLVTIWPGALADRDGEADHLAAFMLFLAMSAGFVSGVGFQPRFVLWRWLFSPAACFLGIALTLVRLLSH